MKFESYEANSLLSEYGFEVQSDTFSGDSDMESEELSQNICDSYYNVTEIEQRKKENIILFGETIIIPMDLIKIFWDLLYRYFSIEQSMIQ